MYGAGTEPLCITPFRWPEPHEPIVPTVCAADQIRAAAVAQVRGWAQALESGAATSLAVAAKREGISTARISQMLVLQRITHEELELLLCRLTRTAL